MTHVSKRHSVTMSQHVGELLRFRELLWMWTGRSIRARYKQSLLGGLWAIIQPLFTMVVFTVIFGGVLQIDTGTTPYAIFSYTGLLPWGLFTSVISGAMGSIVGNMHLITQVYVPREIFAVSVVGTQLFDFAIASSIWILLAIFFGVMPSLLWLWVPVILAVQLALSLGIGLVGAAVAVYYRDVQHGVGLLLGLWMYVTPVIYPAKTYVPEQVSWVYDLNPMVAIIEAYRMVLLEQQAPTISGLGAAAAVSVLALCLGYTIFKRFEHNFGDLV